MSEVFKEGKLVRHKIKGYIGIIDGTTKIIDLLESPNDTFGYRVQPIYSSQSKRLIASPSNLELISEMQLEERHKAHLFYLGISWKGTRKVNLDMHPGKHRITHCWFCKKELDNAIDIECSACGWILCQCGACGCGFKKLKPK
jgi:hypothetical protein